MRRGLTLNVTQHLHRALGWAIHVASPSFFVRDVRLGLMILMGCRCWGDFVFVGSFSQKNRLIMYGMVFSFPCLFQR